MKHTKPYFLILATTLLTLIPVLSNPDLFLNRGNDLQEFFWPIIEYTKISIYKYHILPFWFRPILSGTPLLPDPQAMLFYLPNIIFLILPIGFSFIISSFVHTFAGGVGMYMVGKKLRFSEYTSILIAMLYVLSPRLSAYLEAGHFGLIASWAYLPFVLLASLQIAASPGLLWCIALAIALTGIFYTHSLTFAISAIAACIVVLFSTRKGSYIKASTSLALAALLTFGLVAIVLLPQIFWASDTTRQLLLDQPDVYPKWVGKQEFVRALVSPLLVAGIDTEKWIAVGILPTVLAIAGYFTLNIRRKIIIGLVSIAIFMVSMNNVSPIYNILIDQGWFQLLRVSTRVWFVVTISAILLIGLAIERYREKHKILVDFLVFLILVEMVVASWSVFVRDAPQIKSVPEEILELIADDGDSFRVYCLSSCLSQRDVVQWGIETVEGYSTLQQQNYHKHLWGLTGVYWNNYELQSPPHGSYPQGRVDPDYHALANFGVKYIISPDALHSQELELASQYEKYFLYKNLLFVPPDYKMEFFAPHRYVVSDFSGELILREVYNPDWNAYSNGIKKMSVMETPTAKMKINIDSDTRFVEMKYEPKGYIVGKYITLATIVGILLYFYRLKRLRS